MYGGGGEINGWSDAVEDLVDRGDVDGAIAFLESVVARLQTLDPSSPPPPPSAGGGGNNLGLAAALGDLARLHASRGFSLQADELRSRALVLRARAQGPPPPPSPGNWEPPAKGNDPPQQKIRVSSSSNDQEEEEDDWEAIADLGPTDEALLSLRNEAGVASSPSPEQTEELVTPKRRGRGSFLYKKSCLYSDQPDGGTGLDSHSGSENEAEASGRSLQDEVTGIGNSPFGTAHVLVLFDFPASTRTTELEKLFESFRDRGFSIRWVNDTTALAVFRTPVIAQEARSSIHCPFKVRTLAEDDTILTQVTNKDLEPPYPRPKTSARTAQRLIAQGMGIKLSTKFGSNELKKQEEARKNRIHVRQTLRDDAWGSEEP